MSEELATTQQTAIIPNAQNLRLLATDMFNSRMFRGVENPAQAVAIIQMGAELGFGPVTALNLIKIIQGQMTVAARGLLALANNKAGVTWETLVSDDKKCTIKFSRPKWEDMEISFTIEEARAARLVKSGGAWETYTKDMLFARCASRGIRRIAPDAISGLYATEEIQDAPQFNGVGVVIDAEECEEVTGRGMQAGQAPERASASPSPTPAQSTTKLSKFHLLKEIGDEKERVGDERYYGLLMNGNFKHANDVPPERRQRLLELLRAMEVSENGDEGEV